MNADTAVLADEEGEGKGEGKKGDEKINERGGELRKREERGERMWR